MNFVEAQRQWSSEPTSWKFFLQAEWGLGFSFETFKNIGFWQGRNTFRVKTGTWKQFVFTACHRQPDRTNFAQTALQRTKMFLENNVPPLEADRANTMSFEFFKFHMCWQPQILQQHDGRFAARGQKHVPKALPRNLVRKSCCIKTLPPHLPICVRG